MPRESFTPEPTTESDRIEAMPSQIQLIQFGARGLGRADPEFRQDQDFRRQLSGFLRPCAPCA